MGRRDLLHARERLQPALRLPCLRRFRAEAIDEGLEPRDLALLPRVERLLVREPLSALRFERRIVASVAAQAPRLEADDGRYGRIEKFPVVRHEEEGAGVAGEPALEPHDGVQ